MSKNAQRKERRKKADELKQKYQGSFVCLNMIVGNEEDNIIKCLSSVVNMIDAAVICFNGKDQTMNLINQFLNEHQLPGVVIETSWERDHYGWSRTEALRHAENFLYDLTQNDHRDFASTLKYYAMFMDADDFAVNEDNIEGQFSLNKKSLTHDLYMVNKMRGSKYPFYWLVRIYPDPSIKEVMKNLNFQNYSQLINPNIQVDGLDDPDNSDDSGGSDNSDDSGDSDNSDESDSDQFEGSAIDDEDGPIGPGLSSNRDIPADQDKLKLKSDLGMDKEGPMGPEIPKSNANKITLKEQIEGELKLHQNAKRWIWRGVRHEVPAAMEWPHNEGGIIQGGYIMSRSVGHRARDPMTYMKDLMAFLRELKADPHDSRSIFYAAQSAKNAHLPEIAKVYYKKCLQSNFGYVDEKYQAAIDIVLYQFNRPEKYDKNCYLLMLAHQWCPQRYEAPFYLLFLWKQRKMFRQGYEMAKSVASKSHPNNALLTDVDIVEWKFYYEAGIHALHNGDKQMFRDLLKKALKSNRLSDNVRETIKKDLREHGH